MRVLILTSLYPDEALTETTSAVHDLARFWTKENEVICFKEEWFCVSFKKNKSSFKRETLLKQIGYLRGYAHCEKDGVNIFRFTNISNPFSKYNIKFFRKAFSRIMAYKMNKVLDRLQYKPDVVIAHMPVETIVDYIGYLKIECPRIAVMHSTDLNQLDVNLINKCIVESKIQLLNREFDAIFARSNIIYERLCKIEKLKNVQTAIISSGVKKNMLFTPKQFDWINKKIKLLYVGTLIPRKGVEIIIHSLAELRDQFDFELKIIGDGIEHDKINELIRYLKMDDCARMYGKIPHSEVYQYMSDADIFIMPSKQETFGLVYLEAMANGCITIGSKNEGIDGIIINGKNGFLVNALDKDDLIKCLHKLFVMPIDELKQISNDAKETADRYTLEERSKIYFENICRYVHTAGEVL